MGAVEANSTERDDSFESEGDRVSDARGEEFEWCVRPCCEEPLRAFWGGFVILVTGGAVGVFAKAGGASIVEMLFWGVAGVVILLASLSSFFFTSKYKVDSVGITAQYPLRSKRLKWSEIRRFVHAEGGGYLSTRSKASRMDAYRGMHLRFGVEGRAIVERIERIVEGRRACD